MRFLEAIFAVSCLATTAVSIPVSERSAAKEILPHRIVHQFEDKSWIENIAVRSNGKLLVTALQAPDLFSVDPNAGAHPQPQIIHSFQSLGVGGITEFQPDVFYVLAGNFSVATDDIGNGTYSIWKVDFNSQEGGTTPAVSLLTHLPEGEFLNGLTPLTVTATGGTLLASDSTKGLVWGIDVETGKYSELISLPEMVAPADAPLPIGINGIKILDDYLYWSNSFAETFDRVKIDCEGNVLGAVETLMTGLFIDDFTLDAAGNAWHALGLTERIGVLRPGQKNDTIVLGNPEKLTVAGPTAAEFGRTPQDSKTLYVVTNGGLGAPVNQTLMTGARIIAIDTTTFQ